MNIDERLRRLQRRNRILFVLLLIAGAGILAGYVKASDPANHIIVGSVVTHTLEVDSPRGLQGFEIGVGDDGLESVALSGVNGKSFVQLLAEPGPGGSPSLCVTDGHACRIVAGYIASAYRQDQMSVQLRNKDYKPVWMPKTVNPYTPPGSP